MFYNIQALRGVAAMLVLMHHALPNFQAMNLSNSVVEFVGKFGYIGVDVFFVISGFVMAKTTIDKPKGLPLVKVFLSKRFLRIYLGFLPVFVLALLYYYQFNPGYLAKKEILQSLTLINPNMFVLVISPAWSLTYELYFYLLVALLLFSNKTKPQIVFGMLVFLVIVKNITIPILQYRWLDFFLSSLLLEFISGYFLCYYLDVLSKKKLLPLVVILGTISLGFGLYLNIGYGYMRVLTFGVFAFSLVWFFVLLEKNSVFVVKGFLKKIGDSSYTLYLTHTVLLGAFNTLGVRDYFVKKDIAMIGYILVIVFIIIFSMIFYRIIEAPLYNFFKKYLIKSY
ncbi:Permease of the drug/metabolite transporter (DMT) superfamily [hydrothermal vent metagenome]|uniref:Permease of the drug/metabolite transporter (DMT) superfamily n=1 Tax=hydrothermal vent metagenome TaxID=652676 RepID=A0A3B0VK34_9ZZZZ